MAQDTQVTTIVRSHQIAATLEECGLDSDETASLISELAQELDRSESDLKAVIEENLALARGIAEQFGVTIDTPLLPLVSAAAELPEPVPAVVLHSANESLTILADIAEGIEEEQARDVLMQMVVDGIRLGLGALHSYFALLTRDRRQLVVKYVSASDTSPELAGVVVAVDDKTPLGRAVGNAKAECGEALIQPPLLQGGHFLAQGVKLNGRAIGVCYVETEANLDAAGRRLFRQFHQQIGMILTQCK